MTSISLGSSLATCSDPLVLIAGSTYALQSDADHLDQQSRALAQQASDLREAHPATWTGTAADGWAGRREQFAQTLEAVAQIHSTASATLLLHAQTLAWGQGVAAAAVQMYARGQSLREAELGAVGSLVGSRDQGATDAGVALRRSAEASLEAARQQVITSAQAAAALLDELAAGLPDGRWHVGDFAQGIWSWVTGITDVLWKFNAIRALVDTDGTLRDGAQVVGDGLEMYDALTDDPIGTTERLAQLDLLRDRPGQWWGQLAPDIALTAAGGAVAGARAVRGFSMRLTVPEPTYRPIGADWGVSFFDRDILKFYAGDHATLGSGKGPQFHMPAEDAILLETHHDVLVHTGYAPSIENAVLRVPAGESEIYGIAFPRDELAPRVPVTADAGGHPHYLEGGHTAVRYDDLPGQPGSGGFVVNSTREFVIDGAPQVPDGSVVFELAQDGTWLPLRRFP